MEIFVIFIISYIIANLGSLACIYYLWSSESPYNRSLWKLISCLRKIEHLLTILFIPCINIMVLIILFIIVLFHTEYGVLPKFFGVTIIKN